MEPSVPAVGLPLSTITRTFGNVYPSRSGPILLAVAPMISTQKRRWTSGSLVNRWMWLFDTRGSVGGAGGAGAGGAFWEIPSAAKLRIAAVIENSLIFPSRLFAIKSGNSQHTPKGII